MTTAELFLNPSRTHKALRPIVLACATMEIAFEFTGYKHVNNETLIVSMAIALGETTVAVKVVDDHNVKIVEDQTVIIVVFDDNGVVIKESSGTVEDVLKLM